MVPIDNKHYIHPPFAGPHRELARDSNGHARASGHGNPTSARIPRFLFQSAGRARSGIGLGHDAYSALRASARDALGLAL